MGAVSIAWGCHERIGGAYIDPPPVTREETPDEVDPAEGDPGWVEVHAELLELHLEKSSTYGTDADALANYVETSAAVGEPDEFTPWLRIIEKAQRAVNMIRSGQADLCEEGTDVAALAIGAEALRRRRQP